MDYSERQSGFGRRLARSIWWILRTTIVSLLLFAVIVGLAWGGFLIFEEVQRSMNNVSNRVTINEQRMALLRSDVDNLMTSSTGEREQAARLQTELTNLDRRLAGLEESIAADIERQGQLLAALEENVTAAMSQSQTAVTNTLALEASLVTLQNDVNENRVQIDAIGGEVDGVRASVAALDADVNELGDTVVTVEEARSLSDNFQQTLSLFRVWDLITRARVRLLEERIDPARDDTELALRIMEGIMADDPEESTTQVELVLRRLELALADLPDNPAVAVLDLEIAWDELDAVLTARMLPDIEEAETSLEETPAAEATAAEAVSTATPTSPPLTATPTVSPTATPTISPTATPTP